MSKPSGFSLIEVMVALAIIGVALPALLYLVMNQLDQQVFLRDKAVAQWVALNQLNEQKVRRRIDGSLLNGSDSGQEKMAGRAWYWTIESTTTSVQGFKRLDVSVGRKEGEKLVSMAGFIHD